MSFHDLRQSQCSQSPWVIEPSHPGQRPAFGPGEDRNPSSTCVMTKSSPQRPAFGPGEARNRHVSFMRLRNQRNDPRYDVFSSTPEEEQQAVVTETLVHPAEVASGDYALGAVIAIGTRVADCRMDYFPSKDPESNNGTLRFVGHDSRSWARLYHHHDDGPHTSAPVRAAQTVG